MEISTYFDIIIIVMVIILALKGLFNGFVRELCSTIGIIGGVLIASRFSNNVGEWVNSVIHIKSETLINLFGFIITLALIWILLLLIAEIIVRFIFVKSVRLGISDKILGVIIAGIKIFLVLSVIFFTFSKINFLSNVTAKLKNSTLYPIMINIGDFIVKTDFVSKTREQTSKMMESGMKEIGDSLTSKDNQPKEGE